MKRIGNGYLGKTSKRTKDFTKVSCGHVMALVYADDKGSAKMYSYALIHGLALNQSIMKPSKLVKSYLT